MSYGLNLGWGGPLGDYTGFWEGPIEGYYKLVQGPCRDFPKLGVIIILGGPYKKDSKILVFILGLPILGNCHVAYRE